MNNNILKQHAQTLHLSGLLDSLQLRLQEAEANRLPYAQFLELLLQDEINVRHQRLINRRHKLAEFRELRSLENFDFTFNPTINRALIYELATGQFVAQRRDVLLVGPPGVGKSHLVQAIGREVLKAGFLVLYHSIFDLVRELLSQETQLGEGRLLKKYLKPDSAGTKLSEKSRQALPYFPRASMLRPIGKTLRSYSAKRLSESFQCS